MLHKATKKLQSVTWPSNLIEFTRDQRTRTAVAFRFSGRFQSSADALVFRYAQLLFRYLPNLHTNISKWFFFYGFSVKWLGCCNGIQEAMSGPETSSLTCILQSTREFTRKTILSRENEKGEIPWIPEHDVLKILQWTTITSIRSTAITLTESNELCRIWQGFGFTSHYPRKVKIHKLRENQSREKFGEWRCHYRGADKSLARPGRKQATATKLYHLQTTQKNSEVCPSNQVSTAAMTSASDEKWRPFNCYFQSGRTKNLPAPLYKFFSKHFSWKWLYLHVILLTVRGNLNITGSKMQTKG